MTKMKKRQWNAPAPVSNDHVQAERARTEEFWRRVAEHEQAQEEAANWPEKKAELERTLASIQEELDRKTTECANTQARAEGEKDALQQQILDTVRQIETLTESLRQANVALAQAQAAQPPAAAVRAVAAPMEDLRPRLDEVTRQLATARARIQELEAVSVANLRRELEETKRQLEEANTHNNQLAETIETVMEEMNKANETIEQAANAGLQEMTQHARATAAAHAELNAARRQLQEAQAADTDLQRQLREAQTELNDKTRQLQEAQNKIRDLETPPEAAAAAPAADSARDEFNRQIKEVEKQRDDAVRKAAELERTKETLDEARAKIQEQDQQIQNLRAQLVPAPAAAPAPASDDVERLKKELDAETHKLLRARGDTLYFKNQFQELRTNYEGLQEKMEKLEQDSVATCASAVAKQAGLIFSLASLGDAVTKAPTEEARNQQLLLLLSDLYDYHPVPGTEDCSVSACVKHSILEEWVNQCLDVLEAAGGGESSIEAAAGGSASAASGKLPDKAPAAAGAAGAPKAAEEIAPSTTAMALDEIEEQNPLSFVLELGMRREDFEACKVRDVATSDQNGALVPTTVKNMWNQWCLTNHPDKGGNTEIFQNMRQKFDGFKKWFKEHSEKPQRDEIDRVNMMVQMKQRGDALKTDAETALQENQYREAIQHVREAREAYQEYEKTRNPLGKAKNELESALEALDRIQRDAKKGLSSLSRRRGAGGFADEAPAAAGARGGESSIEAAAGGSADIPTPEDLTGVALDAELEVGGDSDNE